jgi:ABC-type thiamin/hydroxymethylpyrimidine transport system permease subunit
VVLALIAALLVGTKIVLNLPLRLPGHSGIFWMAYLVIGRGLVRKPGAGALLGLVSGLLAVLMVGGREGLLVWVKYFAPGMVMDLGAAISRERLDSAVMATLTGALGNAAKLTASLLVSLILGIPAGYLAVGLGLAAVSHVAFGALGGWLGSLVLRTLRRLKVPAIESLDTGNGRGV